MSLQSYRDLDVWKQALELAVLCYKETKCFPREELFGLTSQIRRASVSIPANIAEGQGRMNTREYIHFLNIANGSLNELETHFYVSQQVGLFQESTTSDLLSRTQRIGQMLVKLRQALQKHLK